MCGFGGMDEKRGRAGGCHRRCDFPADVSGLAHAGNDHAAFAVQQGVGGADETAVQRIGDFVQAECFGT